MVFIVLQYKILFLAQILACSLLATLEPAWLQYIQVASRLQIVSRLPPDCFQIAFRLYLGAHWLGAHAAVILVPIDTRWYYLYLAATQHPEVLAPISWCQR